MKAAYKELDRFLAMAAPGTVAGTRDALWALMEEMEKHDSPVVARHITYLLDLHTFLENLEHMQNSRTESKMRKVG